MDDFLNGLNEFQNQIEKLQNNLEKANGTHEISFKELFTDDLMKDKTKFPSIDVFLEKLGIKTNNDLENYPPIKLDQFVKENTDFSNWNEMKQYASNNYFAKQLGFTD